MATLLPHTSTDSRAENVRQPAFYNAYQMQIHAYNWVP